MADPVIKTIQIRFTEDTPVDFEAVPRGMVGLISFRPYKGDDETKHGAMEKYIPKGRIMTICDYVASGFAEIVE